MATPNATILQRIAAEAGNAISGDDFFEHIATRGPVVLGLDLGTTNTCVAFAVSLGPGFSTPIKIICPWPGDVKGTYKGSPNTQVPTQCLYRLPATSNRSTRSSRKRKFQEDSSEFEDEDDDSENSPAIFWGHQIQDMITPDMDEKQFKLVTRPKLLLADSEHTREPRARSMETLKSLQSSGVFKRSGDLRMASLVDFLTPVLKHVVDAFIRHHSIPRGTKIEPVMSVPTIWGPAANRITQITFEKAVKQSGLNRQFDVGPLYLVCEAEAAAVFAISKNKDVNAGETLMVLDAGGGTVDVGVFEVTSDSPLRLEKEVVKSEGVLHGSGLLNEGLLALMEEKLCTETYLEVHGYTIRGLIRSKLEAFEREFKRVFNNESDIYFEIQGLKKDPRKNFEKNRMKITSDELWMIFEPHFNGIWNLVFRQIQAAEQKGYIVRKILPVGGFLESKFLQGWLENKLRVLSNIKGHQIRLTDPLPEGTNRESAVACGTVQRAVSKSEAPRRTTKWAIGNLQTETFEPEVEPAHDMLERRWREYDYTCAEWVVKHCINWFLTVGEEVESHFERRLTRKHFFLPHVRRLICVEKLFISERAVESHYPYHHRTNSGRQKLGTVRVDLTFLRDEGLIDLTIPEEGEGRARYEVEIVLVVKIEGINISFEVERESEVLGGFKQSIVAAFAPGSW